KDKKILLIVLASLFSPLKSLLRAFYFCFGISIYKQPQNRYKRKIRPLEINIAVEFLLRFRKTKCLLSMVADEQSVGA
ncbi:hypothetical protein, partial [Lactiplantibacillus plantarum]|uniref:hypothetical protein n=1 Tax=Lactiplantibacillus plantarum TaxID=1590 RepID=UPI0037544D06